MLVSSKDKNTAPSKTQSYLDSVHAWSFWLLHPAEIIPHSLGTKMGLVSELPAIIQEQHTSPSSLRAALLPSLPQLSGDSSMEDLEGWPGLAKFSELGHELTSDAPLLFDGFVFA